MKLRPFLPAVAGIVVLAATAAAYHLAAPLTEPSLRRQPDADPLLMEPADPAAEALFVRSVARDLVAREVIAGRTTVTEAAAVLGWLNTLPPRYLDATPEHIAWQAGLPDPGGYTGAERLGVRVVAQVALEARSATPCPPGCVERARAEFLAARARGEFARLPTPPADRCERLLEQARAEAKGYKSGRPDARSVQTAEWHRTRRSYLAPGSPRGGSELEAVRSAVTRG